VNKREGRFEGGHGGDALDEVSEISPPSSQASAFCKARVERVGGTRTLKWMFVSSQQPIEI
jgi:transcriptional regulator with GAF, ATPase, and Fis domain